MKATLLAISLALVGATSAFAQTSTANVYGRLNLTIENEKIGTGSKQTSVNNNSSRIGFRGTEDLGGGLKAHFVIEHGFDPSTGTSSGAFWGRESTLSLSGAFGKVSLGNLAASAAYFATADYVSMHNHDTGSSSDALYSFVATGALKNAIGYASPNFGGMNFEFQIGEGVGGSRPTAAAVNYDAGALHLGLGYEAFGGAKSLALRALYEMGAFTLGGYVEKGSGNNKVSNFRLAGMYAMGPSEFHLNFGSRGNTNSVANSGATQMTLGYNYNLSKRTKVYTYYTRLNADVNAGDYSSLALGMRHNF